MADEERIQKIRDAAAKHGGRYLLSWRRYGYPRVTTQLPETEDDRDYEACTALIARGEARWLRSDNGGPGIQIVCQPAPELPPESPMPLDEALLLLTRVHTRDDWQIGFYAVIGAAPDSWESHDYRRAWEAVRRHLHLQADPPEAT